MTSGSTPSSDACWKLLLKEKGFVRHKFVDVTTSKEEATVSWCDFIIPFVIAKLKTLSLSLQQLPNL